ncbi:MAG: hypothetical protein M1608_02655, partial [Candidatus Omnitrophica bacterium]|nr:hypothetical protein [Candidatus Omnitrophota bacterium]
GVVYRFKAESGKKYVVVLVSTPHISGYLLESPKKAGDLVYEYQAEGAPSQRVDYIEYMQRKSQPLGAILEGARDTDGDGYIEVRSGVAPESRIRHTRLSVIYVFPEGTKVDNLEAVYSGSMNDRCVWHINVGVTPEQGPQTQNYDLSDVGFGRLILPYSDTVPPHSIKTYWIKVPPIHRREPVSMGYIAHAFREVLPGEGIPPISIERLASLKAVNPDAAEEEVIEFWNRFLAGAARFDLPDPILNDIYLSRLATRAIMDVRIMRGVVYNACSPFFYFDHAYRDQSYVVYANDLAGLHARAARVLHAYCMDVKDITKRGPISFDGKPIQLGMLENGLWLTRPGQYDTPGQNLWALVEHYKLSGDRDWLEHTAYPYIKRGAMWIVNSRRKHMQEVGQPDDPRYGLIEPGGMEVLEVGKGMHMYYMNAFAILGLHEAAEAAEALDYDEDARLFASESTQLKESLHRSFEKTFKRTGLYSGYLWFGVEPSGVGMYGFWAHNCLLWPCRALDPHDPMLTATYHMMERMTDDWGGGLFSEGKGGYWPYIGVDRAVSYILRDEPDKALDYFCAYVDVAGGTLSWGEGYGNVIAWGDQPHFWADAQYVNLFRHLFVTEDGSTLMLTPATPRRWQEGTRPIRVTRLPTEFGDLDLVIRPQPDDNRVDYAFKLVPRGDQSRRVLNLVTIDARVPRGRRLSAVRIDDQPASGYVGETVAIAEPKRNREYHISFDIAPE